MCGIAGIFSREEHVSKDKLSAMVRELKHRGPDADGTYIKDTIGMVHTRLSINDLAGGNQPLYSSDKNLVLIANGEIYNHLELRELLQSKGYQYQTHSDCESILYAYQEWGDRFLEYLFGMFAFALFDIGKKTLFLARDRLGIKPLYYIEDKDGLRFASELKALQLNKSERMDINPEALFELMNNNFSTSSRTLLNRVNRVMPGECLVIRSGKIQQRRTYWSLLDIEPIAITQKQAEEKFDELMSEVVPQHLRSDVPVGIFLSGGVDSAVLLSQIRRFTDQPVSSFSVGFPDSDTHNELALARRMADQFETDHHELHLEREQLLEVLPETIWAADDLMGDYANLPVWMLSEYAADKVKVVFSGEGGDEVFAGYGRYRKTLPGKIINALSFAKRSGFRKRGMLKGALVRDIWKKEFLPAAEKWDQRFDELWANCPVGWSDLQRMQYVDISSWLCDDLLVKADRMMMAHGVEGRVPFLDHRIVEFGLSLPDYLKIEQKTGKLFLKKWAENYLPKDHLYGKKKGFTVPVRQWMSDSAYIEKIMDAIGSSEGIDRFFSQQGLQKLFMTSSGSSRHSSARWMLLQLMLWFEGSADNWKRDGNMRAVMQQLL